jgi:hypothetical protein
VALTHSLSTAVSASISLSADRRGRSLIAQLIAELPYGSDAMSLKLVQLIAQAC